MPRLKALIAATTVLALLAQPAVALLPCCCAAPVEEPSPAVGHTCCPTGVAKASTKEPQGAIDSSLAGHFEHESCACFESASEAIAPEAVSTKAPDRQQMAIAGDYQFSDIHAPASSAWRIEHTGRAFSSSPSLLALYCVWLK